MPSYDWQQGFKGAGGGALAGGSIGGPIGAVIGGGLGLLGGFGGGKQDEYNKKLQEYYAGLQNRQAPQMGPAAQSGYSGFRSNQSDLIKRLEALSQGQGPSLAAQQFGQATDRNMGAQQAMASTGRGGAMGAFNASNNMGQLGAQAAQGSAMARTGEEQMALNQLGLSIYGARGADEETNRFNAGQQNQNSQSNLEARLRTMGMNDQAITQILSQMGGQTSKPGMGDQLLAGGAGMFAMGAAHGGMGGTPRMGAPQNGSTGAWSNGQGSLYGMGGPPNYGGQGGGNPWDAWMGRGGF